MTIEFQVPDMACGACSETITKAILAIDPNASVQADTKTKEVKVETAKSASAVKEAITAAGYNPA